jgi:hypothetical protein
LTRVKPVLVRVDLGRHAGLDWGDAMTIMIIVRIGASLTVMP